MSAPQEKSASSRSRGSANFQNATTNNKIFFQGKKFYAFMRDSSQ